MYDKIKCVEATEISVYCTLLAFTVILLCGKIEHLDLEPLVSPFCYRLLAQLRDMEMAFDDFFDKHHLKLQQYLQLLRYEHSFQEVCWFSEYKSNVNRPRKHWTPCVFWTCIVSHRWRVLWRSWVLRKGSSLLQEKPWHRQSRSSKSWIFWRNEPR